MGVYFLTDMKNVTEENATQGWAKNRRQSDERSGGVRARAEEDEECAIVDTGRSPSQAVARCGHAWPERGQPWAGGLSRCDRASTRASTNEKDVRHIECGGQTGRSRQCLEHQWPGFSRARARPSLSLSLRHNAREGTPARTLSMHDQWAETSDDPRPLVSGPKREGGMPTETASRGDANREKREDNN